MSATDKDQSLDAVENSVPAVTLKRYRKIRGGHRSFARRIMQTVYSSVSESDIFSSAEYENLEGCRISLVEKKKTIDSYNEKMLELMDDEEEIMTDIVESSEFSDEINRALLKIKLALEVPVPQNVPLSSKDDKHVPVSSKVKLPKLTLPRFGGEHKKWASFWDSFQAAVGQSDASKVEKLNYLKSLLDGSAAACIDGLQLTDANYDHAVKLLNDRFADKQMSISAHVEELINLKAVLDESNVKGLRKLYDVIEVQIRNLKSLGIESDSYGSVLIPIIMSRLPDELKLLISRGLENWCIEDVLDIIKGELEARERISVGLTKNSSTKTTTTNNYSPQYKRTASTLVSGSSDHRVPFCVFCGQQHLSVNCQTVTDVSARKSILRRKAKCFLCLKSGHIIRNCPNKDYKCFSCGDRHNKAICSSQSKSYNSHSEKKPDQSVTSNMTFDTSDINSILLQTAVAYVSGNRNNNGLNRNLVFDLCSQRTYISNETRDLLNLKVIRQENLLVKTFGEDVPKLRQCDLVQFIVICNDGLELYVNGYCVPSICKPISDQCTSRAVNNYPHLHGLRLANVLDSSEFKVDILIGADFYWNFFSGESRRGEYQGPVAMLSKLGWVLSGPVAKYSNNHEFCTVNLSQTHVLHIDTEICDVSSVKSELSKFWELESLGICNDESSVFNDFQENILFKEKLNKYEVKLPFKESHPFISDNYSTCVKRLSTLLLRLKKNPKVLLEYDKIIGEQLKEGIIDHVHEDYTSLKPGDVHYIPHREVLRLDKETTKLRIVYDASCKANGFSLNDNLYAGPSLNPLIFDVLLRFRMFPVAVTADIQKAFLNISIDESHRDFLRFLWVDNPLSDNPQIKVFRFNRVVFGVTSSPFILNATLRFHLRNCLDDKNILNKIIDSLYVDDFASGTENVNSAFDLCKLVKLKLQQGGFNMRKWCTNSAELVTMLSESTEFPEVEQNVSLESKIAQDESGYSEFVQNVNYDNSVLGQKWDSKSDIFQFDFEKILSCVPTDLVTKRQVLSITAKFFDPVGLISPVVLLFKLCFQTLCNNDLSWDDPLDSKFSHYWNNLVLSLSQVESLNVYRNVCSDLHNADSIQLHVFGDASEKAFGSCVYLRCVHSDSGQIHCNLIASKTRVAPIKKQTIPRLELLACLISVRLVLCVTEALKGTIDPVVYYWSDSQVALAWIKNSNREFKQFVNNRVIEIRKSSDINNWFYCQTFNNPADICSRGCKAAELSNNILWWHGPSFLVDKWLVPKGNNSIQPENVDEEYLVEVRKTTSCVANVEVIPGISSLIEVTDYSNINKLFRVTAYVLRFIRRCRVNGDNEKELSRVEISNAEKLWCKDVQKSLSGSKFEQQKVSLNLKYDG